jgi:hypothetical protein
MFSYYTVYDVESKTLAAAVLRGAAQLDQKSWVFYTNDEGGHASTRLMFDRLSKRGDGIDAVTAQGDRLFFTPATIASVQADPAKYDATPEEAAALQTEGDLYVFLVASAIPEWYVRTFGPSEELAELEEEALLGLAALEEAKGIPAKVGDVHRWNDGHEYEKQSDGSWRRVDTEWTDTHPEVPKDTKSKYHSDTEGWDPQRRATHVRLLGEVGTAAFEGKTPVPPGESPEFMYIMGPPAAGKSTRQSQREYENMVKLDPDEFVERMPEFLHAQKVKARNGASSVHKECEMLNDKLLSDAKEGRYNVVMAGTGGSLDWMVKELFPDLKRRGYRINLVMTYVDDLDELMLRTEARGHVRGRFIPGERTRRLHEVLPKNFKALMKNPDITSLALINSHQDEKRREAKQDFVYQQVGDQKAVLHAEFFDSFMDKSKEGTSDA